MSDDVEVLLPLPLSVARLVWASLGRALEDADAIEEADQDA